MEAVYVGISDTVSGGASVTAPNGNVTSIAATPTPGVYDVECSIILSGTAETLNNNLRLRVNGVVTELGIPTVTGMAITVHFGHVTVTAGTFDLNTAAAATAGAIYTCEIRATRVA